MKPFLFITAFGALLAARSLCAQTLPVSLINLAEHAEVARDTIWLSDLLPFGAPTDLKEMGKSVELGLAPQAGTVRSMTREQIVLRVAEHGDLLRRLRIPAQITVQRTGWPIRGELILAAVSKFLQTQGWKDRIPPGVAWLHWSGAIASRNENVELQVTGVKPDIGQHTLEVRLRCVDRSLCSTFLAVVTLLHQFAAAAKNGQSPSAGQTVASSRLRSVRGTNREPGLVERGASAQLKMEGDGMEISLPVVCLERGSLGEQIRVRAAGNHVLLAEVVGSNQLHASF